MHAVGVKAKGYRAEDKGNPVALRSIVAFRERLRAEREMDPFLR